MGSRPDDPTTPVGPPDAAVRDALLEPAQIGTRAEEARATSLKELSPDELVERARAVLEPRFRPTRLLGKGGMGYVVAAHHVSLDREVAVKLLPDAQSTDPVIRARFLREARAAANLRHPSLVTVHDVEESLGYIVMELVEGETLRQRMKRRGRLSPSEVRRIGAQLLDALSTAHAAGIVHRDVKPSNILFDKSGDVKLTDFGVAFLGDSGLTTPGLYVGTPAYMAPEQLRGRVVDGRADVYSAGATLFEALTGKKLHDDDLDVSDVAGFVFERTGDRALAEALRRAVAERPEARFESARAFAEMLTNDAHDADEWSGVVDATARVPIVSEPGAKDPTSRPSGVAAPDTLTVSSPRRMRWLLAGVSLALLVAGADLGYQWARARGMFAAPATKKLQIALLPFADNSGDESLDFARAGLPFLLGSELSRAPDLSVLGYYKLHASVKDEGSPQEWVRVAKSFGADLLLKGELGPLGEGVRVTLVLVKSDGSEVARWIADGPAEDIPRAVQGLAGEIASRALGAPVTLAQNATGFEFQRSFLSGVAALEAHRIGDAYTHLQNAVAINGTSAQAYYYLAMASWWHNHPANLTRGYIERALRLGPTAPERAFLEGLSLLVERRYKRSIDHFRNAVKQYPDHRDILYGLSEALFHGGYPREGVQYYQRAVTLFPNFKLGMMHALTFAIDHQDKEIFDWAMSFEPSNQYDGIWDARAHMGYRRYNEAIEALLRVSELARSGALPADTAVAAEQELVSAYAAVGRVELAQAFADKWSADIVASKVCQLGLAAARGDRARMTDVRAQLAHLIASFDVAGTSVDQISVAAMAEIPASDPIVLGRLLERIEAVSPPELERDPRTRLILRFVRDRFDGRGTLGPEVEPTTPEIDAVDRAIAARKERRHLDAGESYVEAIRWASDGRFSLLLHFLAAEQFRAAGAHAKVIEQCFEVISPRVVAWEWGSAVGPCLLFTTDAEAALGNAELARAAAQRLKNMRTAAPKDDHLRVQAQRFLDEGP